MFCLHCNKWEVSPEDRYCAWCGEPLTRLAFVHDALPFYPTEPGEELGGELLLLNSGSRPLIARLSAPPGVVLDQTELELLPRTGALRVAFAFRAPAVAYWTESILATVEGGDPVRAQLICSPRPRLELMASTLALHEGERGPFTLTLRHQEGGPAQITAIRSESGRLEVLSRGGSMAPGADLAVQVQCAGGGAATSGTTAETLVVELLNAGTVRLPLAVVVQRPPRVVLTPERFDFGEVLPGRPRRRTVRLVNMGEGPLEVRQVSLAAEVGAWTCEVDKELPAVLRYGGQLQVSVTLPQPVPGQSRAQLTVLSNDPTQPVRTIDVLANVMAEPTVFEGFVGIDFGTTHSCICVAREGEEPQMLVLSEFEPDQEDRVAMPSAVYWPQPPVPGNLADCVVGAPALAMANDSATGDSAVLSVKRRLGQRHPERILGVPLLPQEIAARIIRHLLDRAEDYLSAIVRYAVVTVPANFTPAQVRATVESCRLAGLDSQVVQAHLMDEPVGAALDDAQIMQPGHGEGFHALVYDFGGGTLDISVVRSYVEAGERRIHVLATKGDNAFGGDDLTELLRLHLQQVAEAKLAAQVAADPPERWDAVSSIDLRRLHESNFRALRRTAEAMKRALSDTEMYELGCELAFYRGRERQQQYVSFSLTRREYEELIRPALAKTERQVARALATAQLTAADVSLVLAVGKSSKTPLVRQLLRAWLGQEPVVPAQPKACVARGAFKQGQRLMLAEVGEVTTILRELDKTNCQYGIIVMQGGQRSFLSIIPEGLAFPAVGTFPSGGEAMRIRPGARVPVALNRGENPLAEGNDEIVQIGQIVVGGSGLLPVPLEVTMRVPDHRRIEVDLRVDGQESTAAHFEEY